MSGTALADAASWWRLWRVRRRDAHSSDQGHSPQVTFKVVAGTEPTLSMPMLVANGHRLVFRGEDTMLSTAAGEIAPLTSEGDDRYLKVLINKWERVHTDWRVGRMSRMPSELGSMLEPEAWKGEPRQSQQPPPRHAKVLRCRTVRAQSKLELRAKPAVLSLKTLMSWCLRNPGVTTRSQPSRRWKRRTLPLCKVFLMRRTSLCYYLEMRR